MSNFHDVLIKEIKIGERFRKDYGDIESLKASIEAYKDVSDTGLLEPILLDRENNLLAGGRRLRAFTELGRHRIPAQYLDEVDSTRAREIELEENIQRKDLTWSENNDLITEIHKLKTQKYAGQTKPANLDNSSMPESKKELLRQDPDYIPRQVPAWTQNDTAAITGFSPAQVSRKMALAECVAIIPDLRNEETEQAAWKKIDRRIEEIEREIEFRRLKQIDDLEKDNKVIHGDCLIELENIADHSVDLIIIDPPYGVLQTREGFYDSTIHFDDDPVAAMATLRQCAKHLLRVAKPDAHIYVFFGVKMFAETKGIFEQTGFNVDPLPLAWIKNNAIVTYEDKRYMNSWEPLFFISNYTKRLNNGGHPNVFKYDIVPPSERSNLAEKPIDLIKELINNSSKVGDMVLDCFAGSGVVGCAAKSLGRRFTLIEKDEQQWKESLNRLAKIQSPPILSSTSPDPTPGPISTLNETSPTLDDDVVN